MEYIKDINGNIDEVIFKYTELEVMNIQQILHKDLELPDFQKLILEKREKEAKENHSKMINWQEMMS